jgi:hypothetical protein
MTNRMNIVSSIFESMFFKTRYIFSITADSKYILSVCCGLPFISFELIGKNNFLDLKSIYPKEFSDEFFEKLEKRLENSEIWKGYLVRSGNLPVGGFWWLIPNEKKEQFDSFWVDSKSILFCSAYVHPSYRGKRVFNMMLDFSFNMLKTDFTTRNIILIVEKRNIRSIKSVTRSNLKNLGSNYLVKLFGRNILSIYSQKLGNTKIWTLI